MEENGILDPVNEADLFCLHYVFIPRINRSLQAFSRAWQHHPLSTEGNLSPLQLYTRYSVDNPVFEDTIDVATYGIDLDSEQDIDESQVVVPETDIPFSPLGMQTLATQIDPLADSDSYGADLYINAIRVVYDLMQAKDLLED